MQHTPSPAPVRGWLARNWRFMQKWLAPGLGVKRWVILLSLGVVGIGLAFAHLFWELARNNPVSPVVQLLTLQFLPPYARILLGTIVGSAAILIAIVELNRSILAPLARGRGEALVDVVYSHNKRQKGMRVVALGGGTGLPVVLRSFKPQTRNLTAIVTMADDGGSSGKLRQELGVQPPGDLRNNVVALAGDEDLMAQLMQYRFEQGALEGHSLGNLFLSALADITGSMDRALAEVGKVLAIEGRVLPSTTRDVKLVAEVRTEDGKALRRVEGESNIPKAGGRIARVLLAPENVAAYPDSIRAILSADLIVIGPGSLFTSILPNLLVNGIAEAIRAAHAPRVYVCNIAAQQGETVGFSVADHVLALERHVGRGVFDVVLANSSYPTLNAGERTHYVAPAPPNHEIRGRYLVHEADLTDPARPWRHSPAKLARAIAEAVAVRQSSASGADLVASTFSAQEHRL